MKHKDKILHFLVCFVTSFISPYLALGLAIGKEYGDHKTNGNKWSWGDIIADLIGIAFATIIIITYKRYLT